MLVIVFKASNDEWYRIQNVETFEDVLAIAPRTILERNFFEHESVEDLRSVGYFKPNDCKVIPKIKYSVTIYDDYIE